MIVLGHRGAAGLKPENTKIGFQEAAKIGVKWVEFDAQYFAKDDAWAIIHDDTLDRTTNSKGSVLDKSITELKKLDIGSWFDKSYSGEQILTLRETLSELMKLKLLPNIEIKDFKEEDLIPAVKSLKKILTDFKFSDILVSSFKLDFIEKLREEDKNIKIGYLKIKENSEDIEIAKKNNFNVISYQYENVSKNLIEKVQKNDLLIYAYTVNELKIATKLKSQGIDGIFTDRPDLIMQN